MASAVFLGGVRPARGMEVMTSRSCFIPATWYSGTRNPHCHNRKPHDHGARLVAEAERRPDGG